MLIHCDTKVVHTPLRQASPECESYPPSVADVVPDSDCEDQILLSDVNESPDTAPGMSAE
jgi:hypothetical protein